MAEPSSTEQAPPAKRRDRTHWLYLAVIAAVVLGIVVGFVFPDFAVGLKWLGTAFVALIKMLIAPVIFCTIVLGIGAIRQAAAVGRIGGLALGYFLVMSTVALAIGLVVGNLLHPGGPLRGDDHEGQQADLLADRVRVAQGFGDEQRGHRQVDGRAVEVERVAGRHDHAHRAALDPACSILAISRGSADSDEEVDTISRNSRPR